MQLANLALVTDQHEPLAAQLNRPWLLTEVARPHDRVPVVAQAQGRARVARPDVRDILPGRRPPILDHHAPPAAGAMIPQARRYGDPPPIDASAALKTTGVPTKPPPPRTAREERP